MYFLNTLLWASLAISVTAAPIPSVSHDAFKNETSDDNRLVSRAATTLNKDTLLKAMEDFSETIATRGEIFTIGWRR